MKAILFLAFAASALAQSSADYALVTAVFDEGGGEQTSADYAQRSSLVGTHGIASDATPSVARAGFIAQLYEAASLQLLPVNTVINEGGARQFGAVVTFDDATTLLPATTDVAWSVLSGPIDSVSSSGLVTAGHVYADAIGRIGGSFGGLSQLLTITVRNISDDDFGFYAADGLSDVWQVGWFGESNPAGRADRDADGDGQNNAFEFLSGYSPLDGNAFLKTRVLSWDGSTAQLELSRVQPGTQYEIESSPDLAEWTLRDKVKPEVIEKPFVQALETTDPTTFFRVRLLKLP